MSPRGIAVDANGFVLVSDFSAKQVFRIDPSANPRVCTPLVTGTLLQGPWDVTVTGVITPFEPSDLLVVDAGNGKVYRVDPTDGSSEDLWPALVFTNPVLAIRDLGADYLVLTRNEIHRVTPAGVRTLIATIAPGPEPVDLAGMAVDADGEILVTDAANDRLLRVIPGTGQQIVVADDDSATPALLGSPAGIALDRNGTALIANGGDPADNPAVPTGLVRVNPVSGTTSALTNDAQFMEIVDVALDCER